MDPGLTIAINSKSHLLPQQARNPSLHMSDLRASLDNPERPNIVLAGMGQRLIWRCRLAECSPLEFNISVMHDAAGAPNRSNVMPRLGGRRSQGSTSVDALVEQRKANEYMKRTICKKTRAIRELREELQDSRQEATDIQKRLEKSDRELQRMRRELERYRGWWVNEYCFVKVLLQMIPNPGEVEAIAASSHERFEKYCGIA